MHDLFIESEILTALVTNNIKSKLFIYISFLKDKKKVLVYLLAPIIVPEYKH